MSDVKDLSELIDIAKKINEGKYDIAKLDVDPSSELFEIVSYFNDAIKKLGTVSNAIEDTYEDLPYFEKVLKEVIKDTKSASENILNLTDSINFNIDEMKENFKNLKEKILEGDISYTRGIIDRLLDKTVEGQDVAFDMISALEFQDINKQKVDKLVKVVKDLEKKISDLVLKFSIKSNKIDIETLNRLGEKDSILDDQDLVNKLLKEFGI